MGNSTKKKPAPKRSGFTEKERCIFRFWDGSRTRALDPLRVQSVLAGDAELELNLKKITLTTPMPGVQQEARLAFAAVVQLVQKAFGVQEFTEANGKTAGLTDAECLQLLVEFSAFMAEVKKKAGIPDSPTWSPPTESESSVASSPTPSTSDCGCAGSASSTANPSPSPSVSASP